MSLVMNIPEIRFAVSTVRQVTRLVRQIQAEMVSPAMSKQDRSPVTVADFAAQAVVAGRLAAEFPKDALIAEESSAALRAPGERQLLEQITRYAAYLLPGADPVKVCNWIDRGASEFAPRAWVLDPIDGTKGFLRGGQYAVALALLVEGQVQIGVLGCPNLRQGWIEDHQGPGSLVAAVRGQGSWVSSLADGDSQFEPLHVSERSQPAQARLLRSYESGHTNTAKTEALVQRLGIQAEPVRLDSQAKYAILAAGGGEAIVRLLSTEQPDYREKIWDQAAGALVVEEAGGVITDISGKPFDFTTGRQLTGNRGVLATNGRLHSVFLEALDAVGASD